MSDSDQSIQTKTSMSKDSFSFEDVPIASLSSESSEQDLPEEEQCVTVDLQDPKMDPLEWTVRRVLPIPKKYYWETGNYQISTRTKMWHRAIGTLGFALKCAEKIGEVLANVSGINSSRYEDVTDFMNDEEWETAREIADEARQRRKELKSREERVEYTIQVV